MNKSKAPIIVIIAAVVFLAGLMLFMNGINIGISGVFSFTTKYYETPQEAYEHFESQPLKISEKVDFIQIDDHNGMFIGAGEDNGEESYVFVSMQTKDKKYFCSGFCSVVDYSTDSESSSLGGNKVFLYNGWGRCVGQYEYIIIYDENELEQLDDDYKTQYVSSGHDKGFYFAFKII